ncbi:MAG: small-conductance mechanosensitive channel [bacterium]|nr:small-conductance mechanosensitive channel [bacterium]
MQRTHKKMMLIISLALVIILPFLGGFIRWKGLPPGFGLIPPVKVVEKPGFSWIYFIILAIISAILLAIMVFPKWFGFKYDSKRAPKLDHGGLKAYFPKWFWWGLFFCLLGWIVQWAKFEWMGFFKYLGFIPQWWGFIFVVDGWVYKRNYGDSIVSREPWMMGAVGLVSVVGWGLFEYLNYFIMENWYYPYSDMLTAGQFVILCIFSFSVVRPIIFEFYTLLDSFECISKRYANGPRLKLSPNGTLWMFIAGLLLTFGFGLYPYILFWAVWVGPMLLLTSMIAMLGFWTPFEPIARGNWNTLILISMAALLNGFFYEIWNFGSQFIRPEVMANPNYWKYDVPYVSRFFMFSEMPLLGYFGYLPFGVLNWIWWILSADLFGMSPDLNFSKLLHLDGIEDHE